MQWTQGDSNRAQPPLEGKAFSMPYGQQKSTLADASCSGPRGIRTPGLLNAIETRSQLRYGPGIYLYCLPSALPIPRGGGCVRYGPGNYLYSLPSALPIPRGGGCVRYGPGINFIKITRSAPAVCPSGASRLLMDLEGFEPSASSVRLKRAPNCATGPLTKPGTSFHEKTTRFQSSKILTDSNRDVKLQIISILAWPK